MKRWRGASGTQAYPALPRASPRLLAATIATPIATAATVAIRHSACSVVGNAQLLA